jgi:cation diffusion facilitator CzcD-associated flavoprotein CzcO
VTIADGDSIRHYIEDTAREYGIDRKIRFHHQVERADWDRDHWTVSGEDFRIRCRFLLMCSGYYDYNGGYTPELPGIERFHGRVVHPQKWTEDIDYAGKRVIVIGSGATAVTLVPSLAERAEHVYMLQRSPTYVVSRPAIDPIAKRLRTRVSAQTAADVVRWKNVLVQMAFFQFSRRWPDRMRRLIRKGVRAQLGPDYDIDTHFNPRYNPWDQRLCLVPDADLFRSIKNGRAEVVTDRIATIDETGIALESGRHLDADLIVTATGLRLIFLGGLKVTVDGHTIDPKEHKVYKGAMLSDVPNLAMATGYTNASWTLKSELVLQYACRLIAHMDRKKIARAIPRVGPEDGDAPLLDFNSGYVLRAADHMPRQGTRLPWKLYQNYVRDLWMLRRGRLADGVLEMR